MKKYGKNKSHNFILQHLRGSKNHPLNKEEFVVKRVREWSKPDINELDGFMYPFKVSVSGMPEFIPPTTNK